MRRVLVTGAEGFIGSHVVEQLVSRGWNVTAMVLYNSWSSRGWLEEIPADIMDHVEVVFGDVRDPGAALAATDGVDAIVHLAALIGIPYSYKAPASYIETNVRGTLNMLEAARSRGILSFIHTSTSEVYGSAQKIPMSERHPIHTQSPYAASKAAADHLALSYELTFDVPVTVLRPFNAYGPRQSARAVIPTILTQALASADPIRLGALHPVRDFTFVTDTADAFCRALEVPEARGKVLNVGSGLGISVEDLVHIAGRALNREITIEEDTKRLRPPASEVDRLVCDSTRAREVLGWDPQYASLAGLEMGLSTVADWLITGGHLEAYSPGNYSI